MMMKCVRRYVCGDVPSCRAVQGERSDILETRLEVVIDGEALRSSRSVRDAYLMVM